MTSKTLSLRKEQVVRSMYRLYSHINIPSSKDAKHVRDRNLGDCSESGIIEVEDSDENSWYINV